MFTSVIQNFTKIITACPEKDKANDSPVAYTRSRCTEDHPFDNDSGVIDKEPLGKNSWSAKNQDAVPLMASISNRKCSSLASFLTGTSEGQTCMHFLHEAVHYEVSPDNAYSERQDLHDENRSAESSALMV